MVFGRVLSRSSAPRWATPRAGARIHACGPARLLDGLEAASRHWPEDSLRVEHFVSTVGALDPAREQGFEVELRASGLVLQVRNDQTLLDARSEEHTSD